MTTAEISGAARLTTTPDVRWARRPVLGWTIRLSAIVGPLVLSILFAWFLTAITPSPSSTIVGVFRWILIAAAASLMLFWSERFAWRLLPIATLLELTMAFPDRPPSRFKMAMRTTTSQQLQRRIEDAGVAHKTDTPSEAATRVLELVAALRVHDKVTRGHSERVRAYTQLIADEMNLPDAERDRLRWAGLLHDVGKLLVPTDILNKTGKLTDEEYEIIKTHPENGRKIIVNLIPWLGDSARAVWEHHEKWDGTGYPKGLAGEQVGLAARIVAVADVYDVMTSARSYKDPVSPREARAELARCAGTHFDPAVVRAFLEVSIPRVRRAAGPLSWIVQLALFPTAVFSSTSASAAVVLTGAIGASSAGIGTSALAETFSVFESDKSVVQIDAVPGGAAAAFAPTTDSTSTTSTSTSAPRVAVAPPPSAPPRPPAIVERAVASPVTGTTSTTTTTTTTTPPRVVNTAPPTTQPKRTDDATTTSKPHKTTTTTHPDTSLPHQSTTSTTSTTTSTSTTTTTEPEPTTTTTTTAPDEPTTTITTEPGPPKSELSPDQPLEEG